jgi:MFS family permease
MIAGQPFRQFRQFSPAVLRYFVSIALLGFALDGGIYAVLLNLYLVRLGFGPEQIGLVNAVGTLSFALMALPAGALGQRFGSRRMLLIALGGLVLGTVLVPLADLLPTAWQLPWLAAMLCITYLALALYFVNTAPYLLELVSTAQRNTAFGLQTGLLSLAGFFGSLTGGLLPPLFASVLQLSTTQTAPYRYALICAGIALLPALVALRRPPAVVVPADERPVAPEARAADVPLRLFLGLLALIALVRVLQVSGTAVTNTFFNVYLDGALAMPSAQIGAIIAVGRLLGVPAALATGALTKRFGNFAVVIGASLGTALSMLPLALIPHWSAAAFGFVGVIGLSWIRYASSLVFFLELVPPNRRATVSGVTEMAAGVCFTLLTFGGGYVIVLLGYQTLFLTGAALTALSAVVFWWCFRGRQAHGS